MEQYVRNFIIFDVELYFRVYYVEEPALYSYFSKFIVSTTKFILRSVLKQYASTSF